MRCGGVLGELATRKSPGGLKGGVRAGVKEVSRVVLRALVELVLV